MNSLRVHRSLLRIVWSAAALVSMPTLVGCAGRELPRDMQVVDGMAIYIGVIPAELVKGHPIAPSDPQAMHGGTASSPGAHHLIVALYDEKSGVRITDARIRVGVSDSSNDRQPNMWLEPMRINDTITYGNFLSMGGRGQWRIHLEIQRPGLAHDAQADFQYRHGSN